MQKFTTPIPAVNPKVTNTMLDQQQYEAERKLSLIKDRILTTKHKNSRSKLQSWFSWSTPRHREQNASLGLYLHGPAGRGKTMLMDRFFDSLAITRKLRSHFHTFMRDIHADVFTLRQNQNTKGDPLPIIAQKLAQDYDVLCLDEFLVEDIADAMILGRLFTELFSKNVFVITTSNTSPDNLYHNGLNRALFLPFIELLQQKIEIFTLDNGQDYRQAIANHATKPLRKNRTGKGHKSNPSGLYLTPLSKPNSNYMHDTWQNFAGTHLSKAQPLTLHHTGRDLVIKRACKPCAWFTFDELCGEWLSANDYLAIVYAFPIIFIDKVPQISDSLLSAGQRFITLLDITYDEQTKLIITAAAPPNKLFTTKRLTGAARAASRLTELRQNQTKPQA